MSAKNKRREFITLLGGVALAWPLAARAQQSSKIARVWFFRQAAPNEKDFNAFRSGLRALGYVEGQNLTIEQRYANGVYDRLGELVADLVRLNPDVIVVDGTAAAKAAKAATADVPIVFALGADPVADGLARSLARPEANLTGFTLTAGYQIAGKRVELLKDIKPDLTRLAVLINPDNPTTNPYLRETEKAAGAFSLALRTFDARTAFELFVSLKTARFLGLTISRDFLLRADEVIE